MKFTLMFRPYCGLCHQMLDALKPFQAAYGFDVEIVQIDDFPELEQKYNELVPVLLHDQHEVCYWHLDETALREYLDKAV
ncbi:glutaredoxin family protein [Neisseriaceae bacterium B1]